MAPVPFSLCLVTDRQQIGGRPLQQVVEQALQGGVDAVQLREKDLPARELYEVACRLRDACRQHGARLLINDRVDVALAIDADGVHLPANSFSAPDARRLVGPDRLIGVSTHSLAEAQAAASAGADYVIFGPIFDTPSKRAFGPPLGLDALAEVAGAVTVPVLAIGGITAPRLADICRRGARGVAVIAAILRADNPHRAAQSLKQQLRAVSDAPMRNAP